MESLDMLHEISCEDISRIAQLRRIHRRIKTPENTIKLGKVASE